LGGKGFLEKAEVSRQKAEARERAKGQRGKGGGLSPGIGRENVIFFIGKKAQRHKGTKAEGTKRILTFMQHLETGNSSAQTRTSMSF
jgi:hypothetical protein